LEIAAIVPPRGIFGFFWPFFPMPIARQPLMDSQYIVLICIVVHVCFIGFIVKTLVDLENARHARTDPEIMVKAINDRFLDGCDVVCAISA